MKKTIRFYLGNEDEIKPTSPTAKEMRAATKKAAKWAGKYGFKPYEEQSISVKEAELRAAEIKKNLARLKALGLVKVRMFPVPKEVQKYL